MPKSLKTHPIHLGLSAKAYAEPKFTGMPWYAAYARRRRKDGVEGRLVSMYEFTESWASWEMHPKGDEVVVCVDGAFELVQEIGKRLRKITLRAGEYALNPAGVWHTANVRRKATAIFITAGIGTEHRPRD